jgi:hypothetical protein
MSRRQLEKAKTESNHAAYVMYRRGMVRIDEQFLGDFKRLNAEFRRQHGRDPQPGELEWRAIFDALYDRQVCQERH